MTKRLLFCLTLLAAWLVSVRPAEAQTALISLDLAPSTPPLRSDAPMTFVWRIQSQSSKIIEGQLEVMIKDGSEELGHAVADDVVLTAGEQLVRTTLPPIESNNQYNSLDMYVSFISKNRKSGFVKLDLRAPNQWQRHLVICVCNPWQSNVPADAEATGRSPAHRILERRQNRSHDHHHSGARSSGRPAPRLSRILRLRPRGPGPRRAGRAQRKPVETSFGMGRGRGQPVRRSRQCRPERLSRQLSQPGVPLER